MRKLFLLPVLAFAFATLSAADDAAVRVKSTGSRVVDLNERSSNVTQQESPAGNVQRNDTQPGNVVDKAAQSDNIVSTKTPRGNLIHLKESAPKSLFRAPLVKTSPVAAAAPVAPDERPLWRMLDKQRYRALLDQLDWLRADYPRWRPPARLVSLARDGLLRQRIEQLRAADDAVGLIALAQAHPAAFSCQNIVFMWSLAQAHASLRQAVATERVARRLLDCPNEDDRLATLYKAKAWLAADGWEALLKQEEKSSRSADGERKFQQLRYDHRLQQFVTASDKEDRADTRRLFAALASEIASRKDGAAALLGAWNYYQLAQLEFAAEWFERALQWEASQHEARRGLALCAFQQKRYDAAARHAEALPAETAGRAQLLSDIIVAQAQAAYSAGRHEQALTLLALARSHTALPRHAQLLAAWSDLELGNTDAAAGEFVRLYRETADLESAQGVLNSLTRAGRDDELRRLAHTAPLADLASRHYAERAFAGKRFLAARAIAPAQYAVLGAAAAPQLSLIAATRSKSGTDGLSRLDLQWQPALEAALPAGAMGEVRLRIDRVKLASGALPDNAPLGRYPLLASPYSIQPVTEAQGWQPRLFWRDERSHAWEAELGLTPSGGAVSAEWTGRVAHQRRSGAASWDVSMYREPVRESILSYTGLRDPYQGAAWGRVLKNGALVLLQTRLNERWSLNLQANADWLSGDHVAANRRFATETGIAYHFKLAGFEYAVLGADINTDRFRKNLSQFTYGHGGYFSPQRYWRVGPFFDFMSAERGDFIIKGRASAGRTGKREDAAPLFPLAPDGRTYAAASDAGNAYDLELSGAWRVGEHLQIGALLTKRHSPQYNDYAALGFVRILFEPRKSVLSSDLRASMGKELF